MYQTRYFSTKPNYEEFLTATSKNRKPSAIRALQHYLDKPGTISLGGGMPNASTFPIKGILVELSQACGGGTVAIKNPTDAFQYSATAGMPDLVKLLKELQTYEHGMQNPDIQITTGSQDALTKAFEMLLGPEDTLLVEDYTYSGSLTFLRGLKSKLKSIETDNEGIIPDSLAKILSEWDHTVSKKPQVLYTIPTGSNPTGITTPENRKREIYSICCEHNLLLLEDDPYYYLQFKENRVKSFSSIDKYGRVLRFDSLSKIISSGLRLGFASGPKPLVERLNLHMQSTSLHTSGVSQAVTLALFENWRQNEINPFEGFNGHVRRICYFYEEQLKTCVALAQELLSPHATFDVPQAGMFLWLELKSGTDSRIVAEELVKKDSVLVVPGSEFDPMQGSRKSPFIRISYSTASPEQMKRAFTKVAARLKLLESA
eukprot:CAMPEP_0184014912 /NCGR_PEP_ID=MMETSP0954-20121128/5987_1 /TAXON_ID=627963 /ORGANISM="Aplanochytrium sp, Strain PBS07" /LENGTH=429 /DNA_ID=CAMNT_0026295575 /DNA_START=5 /DNA_END=1294 /DNA_ORIENTATION=+